MQALTDQGFEAGKKRFFSNRGQSLIEVLIAIVIGVLLFIAAVSIIVPLLRTNSDVARGQIANGLARELLENVTVFSQGDWHNIDTLATGTTNHYHLTTSSSPFFKVDGDEQVAVATSTYTRYFYLDDVMRVYPAGQIVTSGGINDPSTKKVTVVYSWGQTTPKGIYQYLIRSGNNIYAQTDWSGGAGQMNATNTVNSKFAASQNIDFSSSTGSIFVSGVSVGPSAPTPPPPPPPPVAVLTIDSDPQAGAAIAVQPLDNNSQGDGTTAFQRIYNVPTNATLTAPASLGSNNFFRWRTGGSDITSSQTASTTVNATTTITAVYAVRLRVQAVLQSGGSIPADIVISPSDKSAPSLADGTTDFDRFYNFGSNVTLTAPPMIFGGNRFFNRWTKNGLTVTTSTTYVADINGSTIIMRAVYSVATIPQ